MSVGRNTDEHFRDLSREWNDSKLGGERGKNHESFVRALQSFCESFPAYAETSALDRLRKSEYSRLDRTGEIYLDYTGGSLHADSQVRAHIDILSTGTFGNPHSADRASSATTEHVESVRGDVLRYFNADPAEYIAVLSPNASGALKLVGKAFPFVASGRLLLTAHTTIP